MAQMLGLAALGVAGCTPAIDHLTQPGIPAKLQPSGGTGRDPIAHLLNRAAFGARPGQIEAVRQIGRAHWIDAQLAYESIPDNGVNLRLRRYDTLGLDAVDMHGFGWDKSYIAGELGAMMLTRATYSERQLYERMVEFWSDHFNIYAFKDEVIFLKTVDDRNVIRRHALGTFGDLLRASAHSPAMLRYLDNTLNEKSHPNENYAREIMELHTLGVDGGYTETDVKEVARCLTGWTVDGRDTFQFRAEWHDTAAKTVLGQTIAAGGGQDDGERVLNILIDHPATRQFVCTKLARHFVADTPSAGLITDCVHTWEVTGGDLRAIMRTLLNHAEFESAPPKFKRPFDLVVSFLRASDANYDGNPHFVEVLSKLGQRPFAWPRPDGYADTMAQWQGNLLDRWNFCSAALASQLPGVSLDLAGLAKRGDSVGDPLTALRFFGRSFLNRDLNAAEEKVLWGIASATGAVDGLRDSLALLIAGPAFQLR